MCWREKKICQLHICRSSVSLLVKDAAFGAKIGESNEEGDESMQDWRSSLQGSSLFALLIVLYVSDVALNLVCEL